jgi:hypothetical protein
MTRIHLQGIGSVPAKEVRQFRPGEWMGWNNGYASQVQNIEPRGSMCIVTFTGGYTRRMKLERLAAIACPTWRQSRG